MSVKLVGGVLLSIGIAIAVMEGVPQRAWTWFAGTDLATNIFSLSGSEEKLPGPLRGLLDNGASSYLSNTGVIQYTNEHREQKGLLPLHVNERLHQAAEAKIDDMFAKQYFEHQSPDGKSPADIIRSQSYEYIIVGENLALGNFKDDQTLVQAWMDSPGHRANILNSKFQEIGVAVRKGMFEGKEVWMAVQEFGLPLSSCPSPKKTLKPQIDANRLQLTSQQEDLRQQKMVIDANHFPNESEYNSAVSRYNALVNQTNKLSEVTQEMVQQYNSAVNEFNQCLESNS